MLPTPKGSSRRSFRKRSFVVGARAGDPVGQIARARLIWAAQTAQAAYDLGLPTILFGNGNSLPLNVDRQAGIDACRRLLTNLYNVAADFELAFTYPPPPTLEGQEDGRWEAQYEFPRHILPHAALVHTRDPRITQQCFRAGTPFIYEDHDEDYHVSIKELESFGLLSKSCRLIIAISDVSKERLVALGAPERKVRVVESGVNSRALNRDDRSTQSWRRFLLDGDKYSFIAVYTGGLQEERGISHIIAAAAQCPDTVFVLVGGNRKDNDRWFSLCKAEGIQNIRIFGYVGQAVACELQQAADVVLMTRLEGPRAAITSPLKFFEYLASGTPIVFAAIPALESFQSYHIAAKSYNPSVDGDLTRQYRACLMEYPRMKHGYDANKTLAEKYTWIERQRRIFEYADFDLNSLDRC